jgi:hypothetical protein
MMTAIPILRYHSVSTDPAGWIAPLSVSPATFADHVDLIAASGRTAMTVSELSAALTGRRPLPRRPIVITFDDGFADFHDHALSFPSTRTRGAVAWTDTDTATSGYYRSLVWRPGLTTDQVTGARYADTGVDPATLRVPGNAEVGGAGAALYDDGGAATASIPAGTRLRVVEGGGTVGDPAVPGVRVEGLDDASIAGWVDAAALIPRDGAPPAIWAIDTGGGAFSPNGDGRFDTAPISARFSETVDWRVRVLDAATVLVKAGTGSEGGVRFVHSRLRAG